MRPNVNKKKLVMVGVLLVLLPLPYLYAKHVSAQGEMVYGAVIYAVVVNPGGVVRQNSTSQGQAGSGAVTAANCDARLYPSRCANLRGDAYPTGNNGFNTYTNNNTETSNWTAAYYDPALYPSRYANLHSNY